MITIADLIRREGREPGGGNKVLRIRLRGPFDGETFVCTLEDFVKASLAYWNAEPA